MKKEVANLIGAVKKVERINRYFLNLKTKFRNRMGKIGARGLDASDS